MTQQIVRMHADEIDIDADLVRRLLGAQFPQWSDLPIERLLPGGTDNAIYRLGDELAARLPRMDWAVPQIEKEARWLGRLAPLLPLAVPAPLATGVPGEGYPFPWSVQRWLPGGNAGFEVLANPIEAAEALGGFVRALQAIPAMGGPSPNLTGTGRGGPLSTRETRFWESLAELAEQVPTLDAGAVAREWQAALDAGPWSRPPVWLHGDLHPGNLLEVSGRLSAAIDWGDLAVGDPAIDCLPAWCLFEGESREAYRRALDVDDATWARGRGWALSIAVIALPYYRDTHPDFVRSARGMIEDLLGDGMTFTSLPADQPS
jgi:aminoglycoside phosphotransferase (APT) family kinase protein